MFRHAPPLVLMLLLTWQPLSAASSDEDYRSCQQTAQRFIEGDALYQLCQQNSTNIPEHLQRAAQNLTDRLNQCGAQLSEAQRQQMFQELEQDPLMQRIKTAADPTQNATRQNLCRNARQRLLDILTEEHRQHGTAP